MRHPKNPLPGSRANPCASTITSDATWENDAHRAVGAEPAVTTALAMVWPATKLRLEASGRAAGLQGPG